MGFFSAAKLILTLECDESTRLVSEGLDRKLSLTERWAVRMHAVGCWSCRRFHRQLQFLHHAGPRRADIELEDHHLSPAARARIAEMLRNRQED